MKPNIGQGDKGKTYLIDERVSKNHSRVIACGAIDELNSFIGLVRANLKDRKIDTILEKIQGDLFVIGSNLATIRSKVSIPKITPEDVKFLEKTMVEFDRELKQLTRFILPTGNQTSALLHVTRTVCRRAEEDIVNVAEKEKINENIIPYVNRLSDLFFTLARVVNKHSGVEETEWESK